MHLAVVSRVSGLLAIGALTLLTIAEGVASESGYSTGTQSGRHPLDAKALVKEGIALMRFNQNGDAAEKLQQAVQIAPNMPEARHSLGLALAKLGRMDEAVAAMRRATELKPDSDASWITLAGFYQASGNIDAALATYKTLLERFPDCKMAAKVEAICQSLRAEQQERRVREQQEKALQEQTSSDAERARSLAENDDYLAQMLYSKGVNRWPRSSMPIAVHIEEGSKTPGYRASFEQILRKSFDDWSAASEGRLTFKFVENAELAAIRCRWTDRVADLANPAEAGDARLVVDSDGIKSAELWFLTQPASRAMPLTDNFFRLVALHEIGHGLGLSGHTGNPEDVMFFSSGFKDYWRELSGRDARSIRRLYSDM